MCEHVALHEKCWIYCESLCVGYFMLYCCSFIKKIWERNLRLIASHLKKKPKPKTFCQIQLSILVSGACWNECRNHLNVTLFQHSKNSAVSYGVDENAPVFCHAWQKNQLLHFGEVSIFFKQLSFFLFPYMLWSLILAACPIIKYFRSKCLVNAGDVSMSGVRGTAYFGKQHIL